MVAVSWLLLLSGLALSVTNEQTSKSRRVDGWLQGRGFSDSELVPEFRSTELELRALLINVTIQVSWERFL